jgi:hypothetical protein
LDEKINQITPKDLVVGVFDKFVQLWVLDEVCNRSQNKHQKYSGKVENQQKGKSAEIEEDVERFVADISQL